MVNDPPPPVLGSVLPIPANDARTDPTTQGARGVDAVDLVLERDVTPVVEMLVLRMEVRNSHVFYVTTLVVVMSNVLANLAETGLSWRGVAGRWQGVWPLFVQIVGGSNHCTNVITVIEEDVDDVGLLASASEILAPYISPGRPGSLAS